jgi:hypothetical protein
MDLLSIRWSDRHPVAVCMWADWLPLVGLQQPPHPQLLQVNGPHKAHGHVPGVICQTQRSVRVHEAQGFAANPVRDHGSIHGADGDSNRSRGALDTAPYKHKQS